MAQNEQEAKQMAQRQAILRTYAAEVSRIQDESIQAVIAGEPDLATSGGKYFAGNLDQLKCPICADLYQHTENPYTLGSDDFAGTVWEGRGDVLAIPVWGECGVKWLLCLGFHKGFTAIFVRVLLSCVDARRNHIEAGTWNNA